MENIKKFIFIILIFTNTVVLPEEKTPLYDDFTPSKISSFTSSLIDRGDYYRAYVELLRLNSFYPDYIQLPVFKITSDYLFYKSKRYDDLLESDYLKITDPVFIPDSLFRVDALIKKNRKKEAESELLQLYERADAGYYNAYLNKRSAYLSILDNKLIDDRLSNEFMIYEELIIYSRNIYDKRKNPILGALAGIVPGMGFIYAGEKGTGFVSMIVIGAGSAVTYASYKEGWNSMALISGVITFFFYGGSIAGGYMQSLRYNDNLVKTLDMRLERELMMEKDLEEIYFKFGLNSNGGK